MCLCIYAGRWEVWLRAVLTTTHLEHRNLSTSEHAISFHCPLSCISTQSSSPYIHAYIHTYLHVHTHHHALGAQESVHSRARNIIPLPTKLHIHTVFISRVIRLTQNPIPVSRTVPIRPHKRPLSLNVIQTYMYNRHV